MGGVMSRPAAHQTLHSNNSRWYARAGSSGNNRVPPRASGVTRSPPIGACLSLTLQIHRDPMVLGAPVDGARLRILPRTKNELLRGRGTVQTQASGGLNSLQRPFARSSRLCSTREDFDAAGDLGPCHLLGVAGHVHGLSSPDGRLRIENDDAYLRP